MSNSLEEQAEHAQEITMKAHRVKQTPSRILCGRFLVGNVVANVTPKHIQNSRKAGVENELATTTKAKKKINQTCITSKSEHRHGLLL